MTAYLRAMGRMAAAVLLVATVMPLQLLILGPLFKNYILAPRLAWGGMARLTGLNIKWKGALEKKHKPVIYIGNHMSYLDLFIFGGSVNARVVGKHEVTKWPLIGPFSRSVKTIFVKRTKEGLPSARRQVAEALNNHDNLIIFPEAGVSDGSGVRRFRTGLFAMMFNEAVQDENGKDIRLNKDLDVLVQPIAMKVTHIGGQDVEKTPVLRERFAWVGQGDSTIVRHIWNVMKTNRMDVEMTVLPFMRPKDYKCREDFMQAAHKKVEAIVVSRNKNNSPSSKL